MEGIGIEEVACHGNVIYGDDTLVIMDSISRRWLRGTKLINLILILVCKDGDMTVDFNGMPMAVSETDFMVCAPGAALDNINVSPDFRAVFFGVSYDKFRICL